MSVNYILSQYMDTAMSQATYDQLEDGTFVGRIPSCALRSPLFYFPLVRPAKLIAP